jgi:hypothetical protein
MPCELDGLYPETTMKKIKMDLVQLGYLPSTRRIRVLRRLRESNRSLCHIWDLT